MPRTSPYSVVLSKVEKSELLRRAVKYTLPYFQVLRAKMILMAAEGLGNHLIASRLDTRREIVSMWRKRFSEQRLAGLEELPRSGRPLVFPPDLIVQIKAIACELPTTRQVPLSHWSVADEHEKSLGLNGLLPAATSIPYCKNWRHLQRSIKRPPDTGIRDRTYEVAYLS